jgi:hypothetical protein
MSLSLCPYHTPVVVDLVKGVSRWVGSDQGGWRVVQVLILYLETTTRYYAFLQRRPAAIPAVLQVKPLIAPAACVSRSAWVASHARGEGIGPL